MSDSIELTTHVLPHTNADDIVQEVDIDAHIARSLTAVLADEANHPAVFQTCNSLNVGAGTPITNVEDLIKIFKDSGIAVDAHLLAEVSDSGPSREPKDITHDEQRIKMNVPRVPIAEYMFDEIIKPLYQTVIDDPFSLELPLSVHEGFKKWFIYDFRYVPNAMDTVEARSATKKPFIHCLNAMFARLFAERGNNLIRILVFGCGRGDADMRRIRKATGGFGNVVYDLYEPFVQINSACRVNPDGSILPGRDFAREERSDFGVEYYDAIIATNSLQYVGYVIDGDYTPLKKLLRSIKKGGYFVGMYPYYHGTATCRKTQAMDKNHPTDANIELLSVEVGREGKIMMNSRIFDKLYSEPILDPTVLQEVGEQLGFSTRVARGADIRPQIPSQIPFKYLNTDKFPEVDAFCTFLMHRDGTKYEDKHIEIPQVLDVSSLPKYSGDLRPHTFLNTGRPLSGALCHDFIVGGPWMCSVKTNGIAANVRVVDGIMYVFTGEYEPFMIDTFSRQRIDLTFQGELVAVPGGHELVFIQLNHLNGTPISFGPGRRAALRMSSGPLRGVRFKEWTYDISSLAAKVRAEALEGIVIMDYLASPPLLLGDNPPMTRKTGSAIYMKCPEWTIDGQTTDTGVYTAQINGKSKTFTVPPHMLKPGRANVAEFGLKSGKFIRYRTDKTHGNSQRVIDGLVRAVSWEDFADKLIKRYVIQWRPIRNNMLFLAKPRTQWTTEDLFLLTISYPRGFIHVEDKAVRTMLYQARKELYGKADLNSLVLSCTDNLSKDAITYLSDLTQIHSKDYQRDLQFNTYVQIATGALARSRKWRKKAPRVPK